MNAVIGALRVILGLDSAAFSKGLSQAQRDLAKAGKKMQALGAGMAQLGQTLTVGLTLPIVAFGAASVKAAQESADAFAQVESALKSMGTASGRSAEQLQAQAAALQDMAAIDDDEILKSVTANLLTFGNIAGDVFDRTQRAILDVSVRMEKDLLSTTVALGKALNAPAEGLASLRRFGIQFTDAQETMIKSMVRAGNVAGAQAVMLGELERQFGGAAEAAAKANKFRQFQIALGQLQEDIGKKLLPLLTPFIERLTSMVDAFSKLSPAMQNFILIGAGVAAVLGPVLIVVGALVSAVGALLPLLAVPAVAIAAPWIAVAAAIAALAFAFKDELGPVVDEFAKTWTALFGPGGPLENAGRNFGEFVGRVFRGVGELIHGVVGTVTNILKALAALLRGDFSAAFGFAWKAVKAAVGGIVGAFAEMFPDVVGYARATVEGVAHWFGSQFDKIVEKNRRDLEMMTGFFRGMWDAVVGHSYVPDMIVGIGQWFGRLDAVMVKPALAAVAQVHEAFAGMEERILAGVGGGAAGRFTPGAGGTSPGGPSGLSEQASAWRDTFREGVKAAMSGDLKSFAQKWIADWAAKGLENALNSIADVLARVFGSMGQAGASSTGGDWLSTALSALPKLFGFAQGGSFEIGGSGGIDSKIAMMRVTPGETGAIWKKGQGPAGGAQQVMVVPSPYFDVVVTDIATPIAARAGAGAVAQANAIIPREMSRVGSQRLGRGR